MRELREQLRRVDELRMPDVWSEARRRVVSDGLREVPLKERPSGARRGAAAVVAFMVFAAGGTLLWRAIQPAPPELRRPSPSPDPATDALGTLPSGWTELAPPPDLRCCAATAWTGSELLVWSGYEYTGFSDEVAEPGGFRFDPISGRTRAMAPSPLGPRSVPASAWTGDELLVWGGQDAAGSRSYDDGAAYDPATDTWRALPPSPLSARVPLSVWTGSEWILWGTGVRRDDRPIDGAAYDPTTDTWRSIATAPIELTDATAAWTGTEMIVFGAALHGGNVPETPTAIAAAYDPDADTWRRLPPSPLDTNSNTAAWNGSELVALDYNHDSAAYDPRTDRWRDLGRVPGDDCEGGLSGSVAIDGDVLAIDCGDALLFGKGSEGWVDVTPADGIFGFAFLPFATTQTMSAALVFGIGDDFDPSGLFAYRPPSDATESTPEPEGLLVLQRSDRAWAFEAGVTTPLGVVEPWDIDPSGRIVALRSDQIWYSAPGTTNSVSFTRRDAVLLIDPSAARPLVLDEAAPNETFNGPAQWSPDGSTIALRLVSYPDPLSQGHPGANSGDTAVCLISVSDGSRTCFPEGGHSVSLDWSADGRGILLAGLAGPISILDARTGALHQLVAPSGGEEAGRLLREDGLGLNSVILTEAWWSFSDRYVAANAAINRGGSVPIIYSSAGEAEAVGSASNDAMPMAWAPSDDVLAYAVADDSLATGGSSSIHLLDPGSGDRVVANLSGTAVGGVIGMTWSPDGQFLALNTFRGTWLLDPQVGLGSLRRLNVPGAIVAWR